MLKNTKNHIIDKNTSKIKSFKVFFHLFNNAVFIKKFFAFNSYTVRKHESVICVKFAELTHTDVHIELCSCFNFFINITSYERQTSVAEPRCAEIFVLEIITQSDSGTIGKT